ncbi:MAG: hypothetical protein A2169_06280 [Deltaproteobacteria bacterium RBG_13_47_9]|nr:MAG: hypothetical protein A2169_06280 [Deltaproteobacteria bacterium RBG_13_47_9]
MIAFAFNEVKTTQVAAFFIKKHGGKINYTKLIKLLYLADREALFRWERPLTGDSYVSMPKGPVLSNTYDLINYRQDPQNKSYWYKFISKKSYDVALKKDPGVDELSKREIDLIEEIQGKYGHKSWGKMIDICHDCCPEWQHPGKTSIPIRIEDILKELKKSEKEIEIIDEEASNLRYFDFILTAN